MSHQPTPPEPREPIAPPPFPQGPEPTPPPIEKERGPQYPVREPGPAHEPERVHDAGRAANRNTPNQENP